MAKYYDREQLKYELEKAKKELQWAENFFNNVTEPGLIEEAVNKMEHSRNKLKQLIKKAKDLGMKGEI